MNLYALIAFVILFGVFVYFQYRHEKMVRDMADRLMSKDFPQYKYYETKFKKDVAEVEAVREEAREERKEVKTEEEEEDDQDRLY